MRILRPVVQIAALPGFTIRQQRALRHDPVLATLAAQLAATREDCAPLAGKSPLNRLALRPDAPTRYARIAADTAALEALFVDLFLDKPMPKPRRRSRLISMPPMIRCTGSSKAGSCMATTIVMSHRRGHHGY